MTRRRRAQRSHQPKMWNYGIESCGEKPNHKTNHHGGNNETPQPSYCIANDRSPSAIASANLAPRSLVENPNVQFLKRTFCSETSPPS
jgi:hypothetical protein